MLFHIQSERSLMASAMMEGTEPMADTQVTTRLVVGLPPLPAVMRIPPVAAQGFCHR